MRPLAASVLLLLSSTAPSLAQDGRLPGYRVAAEAAQREIEAKLRAIPDSDNLREYMKRLSARPHHVGSPYDRENAEWILSKFEEWGFEAEIETFDVLFPTPTARVVELLEPFKFTARLDEPVLAVDPTSDQKSEQLPTYNAYSRDGDVTAPLVYVNYGLPADYEQLERLGISVKGAIVIARYGMSWRGIKPKVAAEHGAVGCIIYSDPRDDGYFVDDVFPEGPMRPKDGVQRGSVLDAPLYPGDPLTPGVGATKDAHRFTVEEAPTLTKIPTLPISYGDAQPLLEALGGPVAPVEWRGALPITYHVGPGPAKVHLKVEANWDLKPVHNVIGRIPGAVYPDEWIIRGNHHDAWVNGAEDPISGMAVMLEEARALGALMKEGFRPDRTIVYCAWDGEEPMLLGSTEWAEAHAEELRRHAVAYVNSDGNGRGYLNMGGSHTLQTFINGVAREVTDPESEVSAFRREQLRRIARATTPEARDALRQGEDLPIAALGSGTDFSAFLDHLGVASLDLAYGGEDEGGIYHSIYDDFYWYTKFSDTDFVYGRALAQTVSTAVVRLANAEILPLDFRALAKTVKGYTNELKTLLEQRQAEIRERNRQIDEGLFAAMEDPRRPTVPPKKEEVPPYLNFAPMENAVGKLEQSAERYATALDAVLSSDSPLPEDRVRALNAKLKDSERKLTSPDGLPRRSWYKHLLYAPGVYTGYDVKTVPGVREAIEQKRYAEANDEIARVAKALEDEAALIDSAASDLESLGR
ncbi:MAG TPA: M28 family metallopeptidase [Vicinamibacteria bacterium]|nr:M28 family metallopeptidase [Vicinamibacteria bacterium]